MDTTVLGDLAGQMLGGRYRVGHAIARGGMATVYTATDTRLERTVALKVLRPDLSADKDFMARFLREARATAALSHPNVVGVFDFDVTDTLAYLVLEYVPGHTLRHLMAEHRLTPSQSLSVVEPVLEALVAAHDAGIVHRDIKPENVLLGRRGAVKVADFGLARAMDSTEHRTRTGLVIGTAAYVSPEHVAGTGTGTASDVYSTGILLFELLTGAPPFTGENALSVAYQHVNSDVPRPSSRVAGLPTELDELVLGATARDPSSRIPSAQAFLDELRRVLELMPPPEPLPLTLQDTSSTLILAGGAPATGSDETDSAGADPGEDDPEAEQDDAAVAVAVLEPGTDLAEADTAEGVAIRPRRGRRIVVLGLVLALLLGGAAWAFLAGPLQRATVPDLVGLAEQDASALLAQSSMRLQVDAQEYSETAAKGTVISHRPEAGSGTFIRLPVSAVISLGPERYAVPDLKGKTVEEATRALESTKLAVAGQRTAFDEDVEKGLVAGTDPAAGASLKPATAVTLIVSDGPAPRPVPDVVGKSRAEATAAIEAAGLVATSKEEYSDKYAAGTVAALDPGAGTEVEKGSTVALTVSKGPPPVEVPRVVDLKRSDAIARLKAAGFAVKVQEGIVTPLDRVYSQDPPPGEFRPRGSTVTISIF